MLGQLCDFTLEFRCRNCTGLKTRRCAVVGSVRHKVELAINHRPMTGEHDNREVLARTSLQVAVRCGKRFKNSSPIRCAIQQELGLDLGIETTRLRVDEGACHVPGITVSKFQPQLTCL